MAEDTDNKAKDNNSARQPGPDQQAGPRLEPQAAGTPDGGKGGSGSAGGKDRADDRGGPAQGDGPAARPGAGFSDFSSEAREAASDPALSRAGEEREREAILDVPVKITAVVGDVKMPVRDLVRLGRGAVVPLNRKLGASIDIYANDRLIARGEITIIEDDNIAVTMTEIMSSSSSM